MGEAQSAKIIKFPQRKKDTLDPCIEAMVKLTYELLKNSKPKDPETEKISPLILLTPPTEG